MATQAADSYDGDSMPCFVAKLPCGHYVAAHTAEPEDWPEALRFIRECQKRGATVELRPVSFLRHGGLNLPHGCKGRQAGHDFPGNGSGNKTNMDNRV